MSKKIALVTGGIGGIGTAITEQLCSQGYFVVASHLEFEQEWASEWLAKQKEAGRDVSIASGDVSSYESTKEMLDGIVAEFGPISVLVNCAGITRDGTLKKMPEENWSAVINTNLNSLYNVTSQLVASMSDSGFGRIVNISSVNGQKGQFGQTNYSAAKAGVHGFTMALAQEVAAKGVTVNTVSPGYVETRMTAAIDEEIRNAIIATVPMKRMAQPSEIAHAVGFLCEEETAYITGANIPVNGGLFTSF